MVWFSHEIVHCPELFVNSIDDFHSQNCHSHGLLAIIIFGRNIYMIQTEATERQDAAISTTEIHYEVLLQSVINQASSRNS